MQSQQRTCIGSNGKDERLSAPAIDESKKILLEVSSGKLSLVDAADALGFADAGFVLHRLRAEGLPLPRLSDADAHRQAAASLDAFKECLLDPAAPARSNKRKKAVVEG